MAEVTTQHADSRVRPRDRRRAQRGRSHRDDRHGAARGLSRRDRRRRRRRIRRRHRRRRRASRRDRRRRADHLGKGGAASLAASARLADGAPRPDAVVLLADADLADSASRLMPLATAVARRRSRPGRRDLRQSRRRRIRARARFRALGDRAPLRPRHARRRSPDSARSATRRSRPSRRFTPAFGMEIGMTVDAVRAGLHGEGDRARSRAPRDRQVAARIHPSRPPAERLPQGLPRTRKPRTVTA